MKSIIDLLIIIVASTNIMLTINEKKTVSVDLYRPLRDYVAVNYSPRQARNLENDLQTLKQMRNSIECISAVDSLTARRDLLQNYFKALTMVESKFPISPDKDDVNSLTFTWHDAFRNESKASQQNIHLEKAAVLFNLGAVHSQIGATFDRSTVEGREQTSHSLLAAAGAFAYLRDNESTKASIGSSTTVDVSVECAGMLERLMLAQARECVFENAMATGSTAGVCFRISREVGLWYKEAVAALNAAPLSQHFNRQGMSHVQLKEALFFAGACYWYSLELHEKEKIGEEILMLKCGISTLTNAKMLNQEGAAQQIVDAINNLEANLNCNLDRAMKENENSYLLNVPIYGSLPPLPANSMVKSMNMNDVLDASNEKMFASLATDSIGKALLRYTEMVDDVMRFQSDKLQQGSELARLKLREMRLPDSALDLEKNLFSLPTTLRNDVETIRLSGGPDVLEDERQKLRDQRWVNRKLLVQIVEIERNEEIENRKFRNRFARHETEPPTAIKNLQNQLDMFEEDLKNAADYDEEISQALRDHMILLAILDTRPIESAFPTLAKPILSLDVNGIAVVRGLMQSLRKLETLGAQRAGLEDKLRDMKSKDDILPKLMTSTCSDEDLFRKEIAKYDDVCEEISYNLQRQEWLLPHIQEQNSMFATVFNIADYRASCERSYQTVRAAIATYREIKENINEGLKFYVALEKAIIHIKQQLHDAVEIRSLQRRYIEEGNKIGLIMMAQHAQDQQKARFQHSFEYTPHVYHPSPSLPPTGFAGSFSGML